MKLDELAIKYGTDKASLDHNYTEIYEKYFNGITNDVKKILELGIYTTQVNNYDKSAASLKMWEDYFPNSNVYGLDLIDFKFIDERHNRIKTLDCNCEIRDNKDFDLEITNPHLIKIYNEFLGGRKGLNEVINSFGTDYDIIIDDGPHTMTGQQKFLGYMFKHLKSGGIFVIEDLHTSNNSQFFHVYNSFPYTEMTTLKMLEHFKNTGEIKSDFITEEEKIYLENNIEFCIIEKAKYAEICFIKKK